ncbi:Ig-like domain-containing protein, partial [Bacillus cereus]|nr:Ig-like domain-containing protein [Bacillus cereus]
LTLNPTSLGQTKNNFIGKSQYPDPYFNGLVDEFRIYSRALNATEVAGLASGTAQNLAATEKITALKEVNVTTRAGEKPELPSVVEATYGEGSTKWVAVEWEDIDPAQYAAPGSFELKGKV